MSGKNVEWGAGGQLSTTRKAGSAQRAPAQGRERTAGTAQVSGVQSGAVQRTGQGARLPVIALKGGAALIAPMFAYPSQGQRRRATATILCSMLIMTAFA